MTNPFAETLNSNQRFKSATLSGFPIGRSFRKARNFFNIYFDKKFDFVFVSRHSFSKSDSSFASQPQQLNQQHNFDRIFQLQCSVKKICTRFPVNFNGLSAEKNVFCIQRKPHYGGIASTINNKIQ